MPRKKKDKAEQDVESFRKAIASSRKSEQLKKENRHLRDQLRETVEQLETARKSRGLVIPQKTRSKKPKIFARLILGDVHGSHAEPEALAALFADLEGIDVREVVLLGDMMECGGLLMQKHVLGYVASLDEVAYEDDIAATNDFLDRLAKLAPKATIHYLEGNHEHRVERWCVDVAEGNKRNAEFLMRAIAPRNVLHLADRRIHYYSQDLTYCGLDTPGTLQLGVSYFTHGITTTKHAAARHVEKFAGCVFYGHTHRADYWPTRLVNVGLASAWCPGCLCKLQPRWKHNAPSGWTHGYILQIVNEADGTFHAFSVPIDNGHSYLTDLLKVAG